MSHTHPAAPSITRNGVQKVLVEDAFGKQSLTPGRKFWKPELDLSKTEDISWFGIDDLSSVINKYTRKAFADIYNDNLDETTGVFNQEQYLLDCADFTAGVAKLSDIEEQLENLQGLQQTYVMDPNFGATVNPDSDEKTPEAIEIENKMRDVAKRIKPLRTQKATIEAKYADRAAKRKAKEEASKTKTAVPADGQVAAPKA